MSKIRLGFSITGSFCCFDKTLKVMEELNNIYEIVPILSFNAANLDTRFFKAEDFISEVENICQRKVLRTIEDVEPIGPKSLTDIMLVLPCTGNTLTKLCKGIIDTPVSMAVKSHLRGNKPVVLGVSTNDGLSGSMKNIGELLNYKNYYFIPFSQDDYLKKPMSLISDFDKVSNTLEKALINHQIQPIIF